MAGTILFFPYSAGGETVEVQPYYWNRCVDVFEEHSIIGLLYASDFNEYPDEFVLDEFALCDVNMHVRCFEDLQINGLYMGADGAGSGCYLCLHFLRDVFWEEEIARYDYDWDYYKIGREEVSEEEMEAWKEEVMAGRVVWYEVRVFQCGPDVPEGYRNGKLSVPAVSCTLREIIPIIRIASKMRNYEKLLINCIAYIDKTVIS